MEKRTELKLDLKHEGWGVEVLWQSGNESVMLCKNIWFPCRKKKHVRVQNAIRRPCGCYDSDFPLPHSYSQADEKQAQKLPHPLPSEHVTPTDSFCESHSLEWEGEEILLCSPLNISHIISRAENVKEQTDWPLSLGRSTLHNANCTSAAITIPC